MSSADQALKEVGKKKLGIGGNWSVNTGTGNRAFFPDEMNACCRLYSFEDLAWVARRAVALAARRRKK